MPNALVLLGHADASSFNAALAEAYTDAFRATGGTATLVRLADLAFDPVLRHGHHEPQPLEPDLTYWASPPAIVRAVVDRLFLPGWAFRYEKGKQLPLGLLAGRSARVVTTMDSPGFWYALSHNRAIHGAFVSGTLRFVGLAPVRTRTIYRLRDLDRPAREALLREMATLALLDRTKAPRSRPVLASAG